MADDHYHGTLSLSGGGVSHPSSLLLPPGSSFTAGPPDLTARLLPHGDAPLPHAGQWPVGRGLGGGLESLCVFGAPHLSGSAVTRCLADGCCWAYGPAIFGGGHPSRLTLSPHFGALTPVWVVSLSAPKLTPGEPVSPLLRGPRVRSLTRDRSLSAPASRISALPRGHPLGRPA